MSTSWAVHVPLLPGELFSTWLSRAALVQGCDPMVLTGSLWPGWRAWTRDLDRGLSIERMDVLVAKSGLGHQQLEEATLRPIVQAIAPHLVNRRVAWPWILAQGSRNRRRFGGLQYCPRCLEDDALPYFRQQWRLAWHIGCDRHGCLLADHCGHCLAPVEPHRCRARDGVQTRCPSCGDDLRLNRTSPACIDVLAFQQTADAILREGSGSWVGVTLELPMWFVAARKHASGRIRVLASDQKPPTLTALPLELLRPSERVVRLRMAYRGMHGIAKGAALPMERRTSITYSRSGLVRTEHPNLMRLPRSQARVQGDWVRLLRRLRLGQP